MTYGTKHLLAGCAALALLVSCSDDPTPVAPSVENKPVVTKPTPVGQNGITVVSPNGGETFQVGGKIAVEWNADTTNLTDAKVLLDCGGNDWFSLTGDGSIPYRLGSKSFDIPDSGYSNSLRKLVAFPAATTCKVKIQDYQIGTSFDVSDAVFTVKAK
ncbi:MAG: hypothetical protein IPK50_04500 [Fibrobacterota bacterium]|nr:MAG: hypothetical protein IPK50_04500 [Fibrobacterota bacterium]